MATSSNPLALLILEGLVPLATTTLLGCGEPSPAAINADAESDAMAAEDAAADDAADVLGEVGPPGNFVTADILGATQFAEYNVSGLGPDWGLIEANVAPSKTSPQWRLNITLPPEPMPFTVHCVGNYVEFYENDVPPQRKFVSRTSTGMCSITFVESSVADTYEGTFTALLRESGTPNDYPVTNGRFRVPRGQ
jgi:hypothetical protein